MCKNSHYIKFLFFSYVFFHIICDNNDIIIKNKGYVVSFTEFCVNYQNCENNFVEDTEFTENNKN